MDISGLATTYRVLAERALDNPGKEFLVYVPAEGDTVSLTYEGLLETVDRIAAGLSGLGIESGAAVVIHMGTSVEFVACWFALAKLGAVSVPTNLASAPAELAHALTVSAAEHVITEVRYLDTVRAAATLSDIDLKTTVVKDPDPDAAGVIALDVLAAADPDTLETAPQIGASQIAEILFTSGTTARPKGAQLTNANLIRAGHRVAYHYQLTEEDRVFTMLPMFHVGGQAMGVMCALVAGGTCVLVERYSATAFWDQVREQGATFVMVVPTHVRTLLAQPPRPDDGDHTLVKVAFGLRITDDERDAFESRFNVRLTYCYGQTEAILLIAIAPLTGDRHWPAVGLPAFDRNVRIVDVDGLDVEVGEVGEVMVEADPGRTVMLGYANDPEATEATIRDGWLQTGDFASFDDRGFIHFADRKKDMIKRAGENVSALEVETVLTAHPLVADAAVIGVPDPIRDEAVKAFIVLVPDASATEQEIVEFCGRYLSSFKVPTEIEFRDALPKTSIGKTIKQELRNQSNG